MDAADLLAKVRSRLDDAVGSGSSLLWSDSEIIDDYANPVRDRMFLAVRSMITDSSTVADASTTPVPLCQITLAQNVAKYATSSKIIRVKRIKLASQPEPLDVLTVATLDVVCPGWQSLPAGTPWACCFDLDTDAVTFVPAPVAADTAKLTVYRFPLTPISLANTNDLGFRAEYQNDLIPGILAMAFSKEDTEAKNPQLAAMEDARFERRMEAIKEELVKRTATTRTNAPRRAFLSK